MKSNLRRRSPLAFHRSPTSHPDSRVFAPSRGHSLHTVLLKKKKKNLHEQPPPQTPSSFQTPAVSLDIVNQIEFSTLIFSTKKKACHSGNNLQPIQQTVPNDEPPFNRHSFPTSRGDCSTNIFPTMTFSEPPGVECRELIGLIVFSKSEGLISLARLPS